MTEEGYHQFDESSSDEEDEEMKSEFPLNPELSEDGTSRSELSYEGK